ncbi:MAG: hypothetical protein ABI472_07920 [Ginsengibacter sp.]
MKKVCSILLIAATQHLTAQNKLPALKISHTIQPDIEKVVKDYYDHFHNIMGEKIAESESTIEYHSNILPQGALESSITQIKSLHNVYSWQATIMNTDEYEKAVEKYKQIYHQLNNANFNMDVHTTWKFKGLYDAPDDGRAFASSILAPDVTERIVQRLKIEVALNYNMPEWTVKVFVYEKESDEDIRPTGKAGM